MSLNESLVDVLNLGIIRAQLAVPTPTATLPTGTDTDIQTLINWVAGIAAVACLVGLMSVAGKMAISHRRNEEFDAGGIGKVLGAGVIISSAALIVNAII